MPKRRSLLKLKRGSAESVVEENAEPLAVESRRRSKRVSFSTDLTEVREFRKELSSQQPENAAPKHNALEFFKELQNTDGPLGMISSMEALSQTIYQPPSDETIAINETLNDPQMFSDNLKSSSTPDATTCSVKKSDARSNLCVPKLTLTSTQDQWNSNMEPTIALDPGVRVMTSRLKGQGDTSAMEMTAVVLSTSASDDMDISETSNMQMTRMEKSSKAPPPCPDEAATETIEIHRKDAVLEQSVTTVIGNASLIKPIDTNLNKTMSGNKQNQVRQQVCNEFDMDNTVNKESSSLVNAEPLSRVLTAKSTGAAELDWTDDDVELEALTASHSSNQPTVGDNSPQVAAANVSNTDNMTSEKSKSLLHQRQTNTNTSKRRSSAAAAILDEEMPEADGFVDSDLVAQVESDDEAEIEIVITGYRSLSTPSMPSELDEELARLEEINRLQTVLTEKKKKAAEDAKRMKADRQQTEQMRKKLTKTIEHNKKVAELLLMQKCVPWDLTLMDVMKYCFQFSIFTRYELAVLNVFTEVDSQNDVTVVAASCERRQLHVDNTKFQHQWKALCRNIAELTDMVTGHLMPLVRLVPLKSMLDTIDAYLQSVIDKASLPDVLHKISGFVANTLSILFELELDIPACGSWHIAIDRPSQLQFCIVTNEAAFTIQLDNFDCSKYPNQQLAISIEEEVGNLRPELKHKLLEDLLAVRAGECYITRMCDVINKLVGIESCYF